MIALHALAAAAGEFALRDITVSVPRGAWSLVLGPAGAGKTTLLETIAGVRRADGGRIALRGDDVTALPPERRGVGMVYQRSYLFPHLTVAGNLGYGATDAAYTRDIAARFGADALFGRPVRSLSGGERQVVALVRALAPRPDILLLDEPWSALDPRGRTRVRRALQDIHRERGLTVLHVTHDFQEAGTLGDFAMLMEGGRLVQAGPPDVLFRKPATATAASFLGAENVMPGTVRRVESGGAGGPDVMAFDAGAFTLVAVGTVAEGAAHAVIRGEDVSLSVGQPVPGSVRNVLAATVAEVAMTGVTTRLTLDVLGLPLVAIITTSAVRELGLAPGTPVNASVKATAVHLC